MTDYFEWIGDYKEGSLSDEQQREFELALQSDPALQKAVENHSVADKALDLLLENDIRRVIQDIDLPQEAIHKRPELNTSKYGVPLVLILLVISLLMYFLFQPEKPKTGEFLFAEYYTDYMRPEVRGEEVDTLTLCDQGHQLIQEGKYTEAQTILEKGITIPDDCQNKSEWYLSLLYIKEERYTEAQEILSRIVEETDNIYSRKAQDLLSEL